jgi:hypothetical protein
MRDSSLNRWLWLIGLVAIAAVFVGFGPLTSGSPDENASGIRVANWYNGHAGQNWAAIYLIGLALALILVYVTQLRAVLRETGGQKLWPNVSFAAGIILIAGFVAAGAEQVELILAAHNHEYAVVHVINFVSDNNELLIIFGVCLLALSTGLAILLNRTVSPLPKTLGWYSVLVGVLAVAGPIGFLDFLFGFPIWILATGIVIAVKTRRGTLGPKPKAGGTTVPAQASAATVAA